MNNRASLQLGGGNWAAKDANLLAYETDLSEKNFLPIELGFERGANLAATRVNSSGLIEKGRENLLLQSNQFDTTWAQSNTTKTSGQSGYDGTNDAWELVRSSGGSLVLNQSLTLSGVYTFSCYVKINASNGFGIGFGSSNYALFNISDALQTSAVSQFGIISSSITYVGNNFYRISVTDNGSFNEVRFINALADGTLATSNGGTFIVQDAQLEQGLVATDYIETGASTAQAGLLEDEPRINYSGSTPSLLLEPSRTNLAFSSETFGGSGVGSVYMNSKIDVTYTPNYGISPEGVKNSTRVQFNDSTAFSYRAVSLSEDNTGSLYVKGTAGEDIRFGFGTNVATDGTIHTFDGTWQRVTHTSSTGTQFYLSNYTGTGNQASDFEIYGLQHEIGSYATSYIPTYGATATRSDDYYSNTSLSNIGSTDRCTFYCEIDLPQGREGSPYFLRFDSPASSFGWKGNYVPSPIISVIGTGNITNSDTITVSTGVHKLIIRWENGVGSIFIDGAKKTEQITSSATEVFDEFRSQGTGYRHLQKSVLVFPETLSDAECITLTTL